MKNNCGPGTPYVFRNDMAPMGHKNPLGIERSNNFLLQLLRMLKEVNRPRQSVGQPFSQGGVPGAIRKKKQRRKASGFHFRLESAGMGVASFTISRTYFYM